MAMKSDSFAGEPAHKCCARLRPGQLAPRRIAAQGGWQAGRLRRRPGARELRARVCTRSSFMWATTRARSSFGSVRRIMLRDDSGGEGLRASGTRCRGETATLASIGWNADSKSAALIQGMVTLDVPVRFARVFARTLVPGVEIHATSRTYSSSSPGAAVPNAFIHRSVRVSHTSVAVSRLVVGTA